MGQVSTNPHHSDIGPGYVDRLLPEDQLCLPSKERLKDKLVEGLRVEEAKA
jgi:hypothetical protein